jgi:hypothetical protein
VDCHQFVAELSRPNVKIGQERYSRHLQAFSHLDFPLIHAIFRAVVRFAGRVGFQFVQKNSCAKKGLMDTIERGLEFRVNPLRPSLFAPAPK